VKNRHNFVTQPVNLLQEYLRTDFRWLSRLPRDNNTTTTSGISVVLSGVLWLQSDEGIDIPMNMGIPIV
jgi:hypothetical protein